MDETTQTNIAQQVNQPIQPPIENPTPTKFEEKPKKNSGLAVILVITTIIATLIAGFFYFQNLQLRSELQKNLPSFTPTPTATIDETANWKTYTNSIFLIKLPTEFKQTEKSINPIQFLNYNSSTAEGRSFDPQKDQCKLKVEIYTSDTDTLESYITQQKKQDEELNGSNTKFTVEDIIVDSQPAKKILTNSPGYYVAIKHPLEQKIISISFGLDFNNNLKLSDQILSTFKFIEEGKINCARPRPEVCTQECIVNPPYICGSDGKSYCTTCQACSNTKVEWYITQNTACEVK